MTIFDWKYKFVSNEWLYVAISRCEDLRDVTFSDYIEKEENNGALHNYFVTKVEL